MPRYKIVERRAHEATYLIDADNLLAAERLDGDIIDSSETDDWAEELVSAEETDEESL